MRNSLETIGGKHLFLILGLKVLFSQGAERIPVLWNVACFIQSSILQYLPQNRGLFEQIKFLAFCPWQTEILNELFQEFVSIQVCFPVGVFKFFMHPLAPSNTSSLQNYWLWWGRAYLKEWGDPLHCNTKYIIVSLSIPHTGHIRVRAN